MFTYFYDVNTFTCICTGPSVMEKVFFSYVLQLLRQTALLVAIVTARDVYRQDFIDTDTYRYSYRCYNM